MKSLFFFVACFVSVTICFSTSIYFTCPPPQNVTKIAETSSSISFDWSDCFCPHQSFQVYYVKDGKASTLYTVSGSAFTFTDLAPGTYEFHFLTVCNGNTSAEIIIEDIVES